jgi:predicted flap endonuclease-1-like 5' DNA nuclease
MQPLPYETATQFAGLALTLIAGWFLGLASRSGGARWRERYQDETLEYGQYRDRIEGELREKNNRIRELEAEVARLGGGSAVAASAAPMVGESAWRGWFGWGRDNLSRIRGIDEARERRLNELGIKTYREIEKMSPDDEVALEQRLGVSPGTIGEEGWREQAALLRAGNDAEHGRRFG